MSKFRGKAPITRDPLLLSMAKFQENGEFSKDPKGVVMKDFLGGKPVDPHFYSLRSHIASAPQSCWGDEVLTLLF